MNETSVVKSEYDRVFQDTETQMDVYQFWSEAVIQVSKGYNTTIFAYGQTGSGKTYTMFGPNWNDEYQGFTRKRVRKFEQSSELSQNDSISQQGVIPRAINEVFESWNQIQQEGANYSIYWSFIQIYNEKLFDLLQDKDTSTALNVREDKFDGIFIEGLSEYQVSSTKDWFTLLKRGEKNRITRQTKSNINSSRSHSIFQLLLESNEVDGNGNFKRCKLNLCDLAGSEKIDTEERLGAKHMEEHK